MFDRFLRVYPRVAAALSIAAGVLVLVAWFTRGSWIASGGIYAPRMRANTALMCIFTGVALWASGRGPVRRRGRLIVSTCAAATIGMAALAMVEHLTWTAIGIDRWITPPPGRWIPPGSSPQIVLAFLALGGALLLLDRSVRGRRPADFLAIAAIVDATIALLGYLFGAPALYLLQAPIPHVGMSIGTAAIVFALGVAVLVARVERSVIAVAIARDSGGAAARRLLAGLMVLPPVAVALLVGAHQHWFTVALASALVLLVALAETSSMIVSTANRLSRADVALRVSEARRRMLVERAADPIFVADIEGHYLEVNDAACQLVGYSRDELLKMSTNDLLLPEDMAAIRKVRSELVTTRAQVSEWRLRRKDGTLVTIEASMKLLPDGRVQGIARDISDRKRAEAALARAASTERALRAELEALIGAVSETMGELTASNVDAVLHAIARQARALIGAEYAACAIRSEPQGELDRWAAVGIPVEIARVLGQGSAAADVPPSFLSIPIKRRDREVGTLFFGGDHQPERFAQDIKIAASLADRVAPAIESALLYEREARLRSFLRNVVDQMPEGVIVIDERGEASAVNRAMIALGAEPSGAGPDQLDLRDLEQRPLRHDDRPLVRALRDGEQVRDRELLLRSRDGRLIPIAASAGPVRADDQRIIGAVIVIADIEERKEVERLRQEWVAVVAHDLRQPLNTILLSSDLVRKVSADGPATPMLERIHAAAVHLNRMVGDLLDAARIEAKQLALDRRATDVVELVQRVVDTTRLGEPSLELRIVATGREVAWADPDRVEQVVVNLISNAIKYGTDGAPVRVEITGREREVEVAVINQGVPIPRDMQARLFTRFTRTREPRTARIPGVGLGLYISKGLVEAQRGRIWVESEGNTTSFRFTLPRKP